jgi:zinc protease
MSRKLALLPCILSSMLLAAPSAYAANQSNDFELHLIPYDIHARDYQFPSGLRVIFQEDHTRPIVSVTSMIDVGSANEPQGLDGMAHVIEHLNFRARHSNLPKNMDLIKQFGGAFNASTHEDFTNYMTIAPVDAIVPILKLESFRLKNAIEGVTEDVLKTEKEVVRNELRQDLEQGPGEVFGWLNEQLYPMDHPYHRTVIGTHETLNNITLKDVQDFVNKGYVPANTTIVVVGDFKLEDTWKFIQEAFLPEQIVDPKNPTAPLELVTLPPRISGPSAEPPKPIGHEIKRYKGPVDKTTILIGWSLPGAYRGQDALMNMTVGMMNIAMGKHLFPDWDYRFDTISGFGCSFQPTKLSSTAVCFIETDGKEKPEKLVNDALDGLYELWNTDNRYQAQRGQYVQDSIPIDEIYKYSKLEYMAGSFQTVEDVSDLWGRASAVSEYTHYTGDPGYYSRQFEQIGKVNVFDAANLAYKYLNRDRYVALVVEPYADDEKAQLERKGLEGEYTGTTRDDMNASLFKAGEMTNSLIEKSIVAPHLQDRMVYTLDNGLNVVLIPHAGSPVARARLVFLGGSRNTKPERVADFADHYLDFRMKHSALEFAGGVSKSMDETSTRLSVEGSAGNVRAELLLLKEMVDNVDVQVSEVGKYVKGLKSSRDDNEKKPETWAERMRWGRLLPDHPLSRYLTDDDLKTIKSWGKSEVMNWIDQVFDPGDAALLVVGNMDPVKIKADVQEIFGSWKPSDVARKGPAPGLDRPANPPARQILVFDKPGATQSDVTMGCMLVPATLANAAPRSVLADVVTERFWRVLRETAGATYGAYAYPAEYRGGLAILSANTLIRNANVGLAAKTFISELQSVKDGKVTNDEIQNIKWNYGRTVTTQYQTTAQVLESLTGLLNRGYPVDSAMSLGERIPAVTPADLAALLDPCVGHEIITIVGPKDTVLADLKTNGLSGEVVDWQALIQNKEDKDAKDKTAEKDEKSK